MIDIQSLRQWKGRTAAWDGEVTEEPFACMAATLGRRDLFGGKASVLPPLWHWLYGKPILEQRDLRPDGMPRESDILPPIALPRRMWASSSIQFHSDLYVGDTLRRSSEIADIVHKQGRSGELVFVELVHTLMSQRGLALTERHTIVFRDLETARPAQPETLERAGASSQRGTEGEAHPKAEYSREIVPDEILLFRYSALTFNSHRIHYDRSYATQTEGYPGLLVHGPLIATLLLDLVGRNFSDRRVQEFSFKAINPIFDLHPFRVCMRLDPAVNKRFSMWALDHADRICMQADGVFV